MRTRREYTKEFKEDAVRLAKERGNINEAARGLGINASVLRRWKRQHEEAPGQAFPGKGKPRDAEMAVLQRELRRIKEENEILKKAMGIFTKAPR
jgi:transposase